MNLEVVSALAAEMQGAAGVAVASVEAGAVVAQLDPEPGRCCVTLGVRRG
jgi:hypothetical protein